jgi:hypothetical protein
MHDYNPEVWEFPHVTKTKRNKDLSLYEFAAFATNTGVKNNPLNYLGGHDRRW